MSDNTTDIQAEWWEQVQVAIDTLYRLAPLEEPDDPCLSVALGTGLDPDTGYTIPAARGRVAGADGATKGFSANPTTHGLQVLVEVNALLEERLASKQQGVH